MALHLLGEGATVDISPNVVRSDSWNSFEIRIRLGKGGLSEKDSIGIVCGSNLDRWQMRYPSHIWGTYKPWQACDPAAAGFVTASCCSRDVELDLSVGSSGGNKPFHNLPGHFVRSLKKRLRYVLEVTPLARLSEGEGIIVRWGDTTWGSPGVRAPSVAIDYFFLPFKYSSLGKYDEELPIRRGDFACLPCIRVKSKEAVRFHIAVQPLIGKGESFDIHLAAIDEYGNLAEDFAGKIILSCTDKRAKFSKEIALASRHKGKLKVKGFRLAREAWHTISAKCGSVSGKSNQLLVSPREPGERIFFGDMHAHTLDCDGVLSAHNHFSYARDVAGLDFASLGSHAEYFGTKKAWESYLQEATRSNKRGRFVTFYGYEWAGEGHINAYFCKQEDVVNIYGKRLLKGKHTKDKPEFRIPSNKVKRFMGLLRNMKCPKLAITHLNSGRAMEYFDDSIIRLHEVYSVHYPHRLDSQLQELLGLGLKLGVVAGSDAHGFPMGSLCGKPGDIWRYPPVIDSEPGRTPQNKCGLQATLASGLTREQLFKAMKSRFTYGTSGARIVLLFSANGANMGQEVELKPGHYPEFLVQIGGTATITEVIINKYDGRNWSAIIRKAPHRTTCDFRCKDKHFKGRAIYYLKVIQKDSECAWSSPIWVSNSG